MDTSLLQAMFDFHHMSVFEVAMLICFGCAWPVSIYRSWKSVSVAGKSLFFSVIVILGYLAGALNKIVYHMDGAFLFYLLNAALVMIDASIVFYKRKNKRKKFNNNHFRSETVDSRTDI